MRRGGLIFALVLLAGPGMADSLDDLVAGVWSWERHQDGTCGTTIRYDLHAGRSRITAHFSEVVQSRIGEVKQAEYRVLGHRAGSVELALEGETWRDETGAPVRWTLVFTGADAFVWVRSDWPPGKSTRAVHRCALSG